MYIFFPGTCFVKPIHLTDYSEKQAYEETQKIEKKRDNVVSTFL